MPEQDQNGAVPAMPSEPTMTEGETAAPAPAAPADDAPATDEAAA